MKFGDEEQEISPVLGRLLQGLSSGFLWIGQDNPSQVFNHHSYSLKKGIWMITIINPTRFDVSHFSRTWSTLDQHDVWSCGKWAQFPDQQWIHEGGISKAGFILPRKINATLSVLPFLESADQGWTGQEGLCSRGQCSLSELKAKIFKQNSATRLMQRILIEETDFERHAQTFQLLLGETQYCFDGGAREALCRILECQSWVCS